MEEHFCCVLLYILLSEQLSADVLNLQLVPGPGKIWGVYQQPTGVEADPPPVLLGADVDSLLPAGVAAGVPLCWPAVQGEPLVKGKYTGDNAPSLTVNTHHKPLTSSSFAEVRLHDSRFTDP